MLRRTIVALSLVPLLTAASPLPDIVLTEAYRFGADPGRMYSLAVRNGSGTTAPLKLLPPSQLGVRTLDFSGHESGRARGVIELTGPKAIWAAQRTLPGTNLDFVAAAIRSASAPWPAMTPAPISFDLQSYSAIFPPPKDDRSFADHADEIVWSGNWASGAPSYARMLRQALGVVMQPPRPPQFGLKPDTAAVDHAFLTQAPGRLGRMVLAVGRMDSNSERAEHAYWTQAVFALLPDTGSQMRIVTIVPAFDPQRNDGAERFRRTYRIVDLIDRQGNGNLDILLSVTDEKERHLELYGWDGKGYVQLAKSPQTGVPQVLDE